MNLSKPYFYFIVIGLLIFFSIPFAESDTFADIATKRGFGDRVEDLRNFSQLEGYPKRETNVADKYKGPIVDVLHHTHAYWGQLTKHLRKIGEDKPAIDSEDMIEMTKSLGVVHSITSEPPRIKGLYGDPIRFAQKHRTFSALCSPHFVAYEHQREMKRARHLLNQVEKNLHNKNCIGIGEVGVKHFNKSDKYYEFSDSTHVQKNVEISFESPNLKRALQLSHIYKVPILLHLEPRHTLHRIDNVEETKDWYKRICQKYKNSKIVLVHNGMFEPKHLGSVFDHCLNMYSSFKIMRPSWNYYWKFHDLHIVNNMDPEFSERWAKFLERYPDRMMFGSNIFLRKMRKRGTQNTYREIIHSVRMMIGSLSKEVQKQIMYETPIKVFRLNLKTHQ